MLRRAHTAYSARTRADSSSFFASHKTPPRLHEYLTSAFKMGSQAFTKWPRSTLATFSAYFGVPHSCHGRGLSYFFGNKKANLLM
jgi:hypothetical protein